VEVKGTQLRRGLLAQFLCTPLLGFVVGLVLRRASTSRATRRQLQLVGDEALNLLQLTRPDPVSRPNGERQPRRCEANMVVQVVRCRILHSCPLTRFAAGLLMAAWYRPLKYGPRGLISGGQRRTTWRLLARSQAHRSSRTGRRTRAQPLTYRTASGSLQSPNANAVVCRYRIRFCHVYPNVMGGCDDATFLESSGQADCRQPRHDMATRLF
jgi:hypothetical protein